MNKLKKFYHCILYRWNEMMMCGNNSVGEILEYGERSHYHLMRHLNYD